MKRSTTRSMNHPHALAALCAAVVLAAGPAWAGEGHDHGDAAPAVAGPALPRFSAVSETFELVGVLSGPQLTLYLDRFADNSPVRGAQIELAMGGARYTAKDRGDDTYEVVLPEAPKPGVLPITATVMAGSDADLLAGDLDIHEQAHDEHAAHTHAWTAYAGWGAAAIVTLGLLGWGGRRVMAARSLRTGGAA